VEQKLVGQKQEQAEQTLIEAASAEPMVLEQKLAEAASAEQTFVQ
jgi:hypothetical protein